MFRRAPVICIINNAWKKLLLVLGVLRADEFEPQRVLLACGRAGGGSSEEEVERDFSRLL